MLRPEGQRLRGDALPKLNCSLSFTPKVHCVEPRSGPLGHHARFSPAISCTTPSSCPTVGEGHRQRPSFCLLQLFPSPPPFHPLPRPELTLPYPLLTPPPPGQPPCLSL